MRFLTLGARERRPGPPPAAGGDRGKRKKSQEFEKEEASEGPAPTFNADASLEAILEELKQRGIGRK